MKQPKNPFHPGVMLLEEFLVPGGITQTAFAKKLGWTRARLNELIKGKRGITAESAFDDLMKTCRLEHPPVLVLVESAKREPGFSRIAAKVIREWTLH